MKRRLFALAFLVVPVMAASQAELKPATRPFNFPQTVSQLEAASEDWTNSLLQPRSGARLQPTAQAVGGKEEQGQAPEGRKKSSGTASSSPPAPKPAADAQLYRNTTFGFRFKVPYGWVDRTKEMREREGSEKADATENEAKNKPAKEKNTPPGDVLLAVFERPPDAIGETVNSAVVIASESAAVYPGLKKAEDYLSPLTELATAKGFKADGDPEILTIDSRQLVRANFTKPLNDKLTMHQSTLILLVKGRIVSFTFIAGSEDEIDDLIENLGFAGSGPK